MTDYEILQELIKAVREERNIDIVTKPIVPWTSGNGAGFTRCQVCGQTRQIGFICTNCNCASDKGNEIAFIDKATRKSTYYSLDAKGGLRIS